MDQGRSNQPGVDDAEAYVYYNSPGVLTSADCKTYHAEVAYGWGAAQPMIMDFAISINLDSVPLDDVFYPEGHICEECLLNIPYGSIAINVPTINGLGETLICVACARDAEWARMYTQPWEIDLALIREMVTLNDGESVGTVAGDVQITRTSADTVTFNLRGMDVDGSRTHCFLNLPLDRLWALLQEIDRFMNASDMEAIESAFLDSALDQLEALANGETL